MPEAIAAACSGFIAPSGNSATMVTASLPEFSLPAATPPNLRKSFSLMADGLPVPITTRRGALIPSGARISSTEPLLPLNWLVTAARLTVSAAFPNALWDASPNFNCSSQNTTRMPRAAAENGTKPTLTASDMGNPPELGAVAGPGAAPRCQERLFYGGPDSIRPS